MIHFALAENSTKLGDHVFVIVPKTKISATGRRLICRGEKDLEVLEAVVDQIHYGWSHLTSKNSWSCSIAQIVKDDNPLNGRYIQNVPLTDCFSSESEAKQELQRRVSAE